MVRYRVFRKVVNEIIEEYDANSVLIVGKGANTKPEDFDQLNDIDILIVTNSRINFNRQVEVLYDVPFDISYISIFELISCIEGKEAIWVNMLNSCQAFYETDELMSGIILRAKEIWEQGPHSLSEMEKKLIRFEITQLFVDMENRIHDPIVASYLINEIFSSLVKRFYALNGIWLPKRKYRIQSIETIDKVFYDLVIEYLSVSGLQERKDTVEKMINKILSPIGGKLYKWEKGEFPDIKI